MRVKLSLDLRKIDYCQTPGVESRIGCAATRLFQGLCYVLGLYVFGFWSVPRMDWEFNRCRFGKMCGWRLFELFGEVCEIESGFGFDEKLSNVSCRSSDVKGFDYLRGKWIRCVPFKKLLKSFEWRNEIGIWTVWKMYYFELRIWLFSNRDWFIVLFDVYVFTI